jgi:protein-ribulosamine 3-kinase
MQNTLLSETVERALGQAAHACGPFSWRPLGEGVGGARWRLGVEGRYWFVKVGDAEMLAAEADGLGALAACGALRVPRVLDAGAAGEEGFLLLEWLPLVRGSVGDAARLGEALARQHLAPVERFGWPRANFIGATPQFNTPSGDWPAFFREQRLGFQLRLAAENGHRGELQTHGAELMAGLSAFFTGYKPAPALLHGDLWGGNWGTVADLGPVVFDPAVYYGDREADLAMTELFGGYPAEFYAAYEAHAPLDAGYPVRRGLYNLYHVLNHLNLFGEGYLGQAMEMMRRLLAELH